MDDIKKLMIAIFICAAFGVSIVGFQIIQEERARDHAEKIFAEEIMPDMIRTADEKCEADLSRLEMDYRLEIEKEKGGWTVNIDIDNHFRCPGVDPQGGLSEGAYGEEYLDEQLTALGLALAEYEPAGTYTHKGKEIRFRIITESLPDDYRDRYELYVQGWYDTYHCEFSKYELEQREREKLREQKKQEEQKSGENTSPEVQDSGDDSPWYPKRSYRGSGKSAGYSSPAVDPDDHDIDGYYEDNMDLYDDIDEAYDGFEDDEDAWEDY